MAQKRHLLLPVVFAFVCGAVCVAQDWQPAIVRDVSDAGGKVNVKSDHGELRFTEAGEVTQTFAIQTVDKVYYAQRTESGRFAHACETPVKTHVEVKLSKEGDRLTLDDNGDKYHFFIKKVMTLQQYASVPLHERHSAMEEAVSPDGKTDTSVKTAGLD